MAFKDGVSQIIKLLGTSLTAIPLPVRMMIVKSAFADLARPTFRAADALGPAQLTNFRITFRLIDQVLNIEHRPLLALLDLFGSAYRSFTPFANYLLETQLEPLFYFGS